MSDDSRGVIAKILALYLITSGISLLLFLGLFYAKQEELLLLEGAERLKEARGAIFVTLRERGVEGLAPLSEDLGLKMALLHPTKGILYSNLKEIPLFEREGLQERSGKVYLHLRFPLGREGMMRGGGRHHDEMVERFRRGVGEAVLILEGEDIQRALLWLRWKLLGVFLGALVMIGAVAYFLVKLSLRPLHEKIETLNRFIKDSTHEINTPLSVIMMSIETMEREGLSAKNEKKIRNIELAAKSLSHLYEDLVCLNFPHAIPQHREEIFMEGLLRERVDYFAPFASRRQVRFSLEIAPATLRGNRYKICRMMDNLISNAIKYTGVGGEITLRLSSGKLEIIDEGEGMSQEERSKMFERYTRFNRDQGGFGIGLSLVREVCLEHQISLDCESEKGKGTKFTLTWEEEKNNG